ncbi:uncharacterized protein AKAME5_000710300 [Lates japonicus]|uniref:Chemokine interleukin-8-like domain-containing protein n=1 Tax=Lates japonicus TaxID=270547 RepID=A0AAD3R3U2_LATJO|nr:uncharacterized protein AKAME5_000710300 [Lates japonicus]
MWKLLSLLLTLGVVMLFSASEGFIHFPCCKGGHFKLKKEIQTCFNQTRRPDCNATAFLIITKTKELRCMNQTSQWLQKKIDKGLKCGPLFRISKRRFKVLNDGDNAAALTKRRRKEAIRNIFD